MQCCGAIYHLVDPKIDKIHKIHAPKFQGVFFLRSPQRRRQLPPDAYCWGTLKPNKMSNISRHVRHFSISVTFQKLNIEILKCAWERFPHVQKIRYETHRKSLSIRFSFVYLAKIAALFWILDAGTWIQLPGCRNQDASKVQDP